MFVDWVDELQKELFSLIIYILWALRFYLEIKWKQLSPWALE